MASTKLGIYISTVLVLKKRHDANYLAKKVWLRNTMKLPVCDKIKLVAATTAAD